METPIQSPNQDAPPTLSKKLPIWAEGLILFVVILALVALLQFSTPDLIGNDGYYHIKVAYLMRTEGLRLDFDWLELTILNSEDYTDHHFLYHAFMMPFTFGDLRLGAKWAATVLPSLAFMAAWGLLRGQKVKYAALWTLAILAISEGFLYRMVMPRAQSMSLGTLVLATHFVITKQYRYLLPLAVFYAWLYNAKGSK